MIRRTFLAVAAALLIGCRSRFKEPSPMPSQAIDWPDRIATRAAQHCPESRIAQFDPATLLLIAQLIWGLIRYCMAAQIRRQHAAIVKNPHGAVEHKMRSKLTRQYIDAHPDADAVEIDHYVSDTLAAFAAASEAEVEEMIAAAKSRTDEDELVWDNARRATELTGVSE